MSEFETLAKVIEISHLEEHVEKKLIKIVGYLKERLQLGDVHFLLFKEKGNMFKLSYSTNEDIRADMDEVALSDVALLSVFNSHENRFENNYTPGGEIKSVLYDDLSTGRNLFTLAIFNFSDFFGVVAGEKLSKFTRLDEKLLSLIAVEISGMVCNAACFVEMNKSINEISTLFSISKLFIRNERLGELCLKIVAHISTLLYANTVVLELSAPGLDDDIKKMYVHNKDHEYDIDGPLIQSIIKEVKSTCDHVYVKDSVHDERCAGYEPDFLSALFIPIEFDSNVMGVLGLIDKETNLFKIESHFSEGEFEILKSLANQFANFVENAIILNEKEAISNEHEIQSRELSILHDVSNAMMTTVKLDVLLHKILTAVTTGGGLGFNRAGLFLINERTGTLQGMLGIGPDSGEDAERIWAELNKSPKSLKQQIDVEYKKQERRKSLFDESIKLTRISLDRLDDALIRAINEKKAIMVSSSEESKNDAEYIKGLKPGCYAAVPLMAKDKVLGALYVDNSFTGCEITDEHLDFLMLFANQAGLAIENSTLYGNLTKANSELLASHQKLVHSEKLAALGEMAADVAHEIKNPLMSIGGFARRLKKRIPDESSSEMNYTNIIIREVSRLEKILNEILNFSKEESANNFKFNNINSIIGETLVIFDNELLENNITVNTDLQEDLPNIRCDYQQIKQAIINLCNNSCQAMLDGGTLTINTRKALLHNEESVVIEISDSGGGIDSDVLHNIFNPFFTTKDGGTGLGLAITHRLIVNHAGRIEVNNNPGQGVTFIINIPVLNEEPKKTEGKNEQKIIVSG